MRIIHQFLVTTPFSQKRGFQFLPPMALHVVNFFSTDFSWRLMLFAIELNIDDGHDAAEPNVMRH
jgi:hypothetical protein